MEPSALEFADVAEHARAFLVPRLFPGVRLIARHGLESGHVSVSRLGAGRALRVADVAERIERTPSSGADETSGFVKVLLQTRGESRLAYRGRRAELRRGDLAILDGRDAFHIDLGRGYEQVLFQLPRAIVERRHDVLVRHAGRIHARDDPANAMAFASLEAIFTHLAHLGPEQRAHALEAVLGLLGLLRDPAVDRAAGAEGRFARALADIDAHLPDPDLSPSTLAALQRISRRRLDAIFAERGVSAERRIWDRRLERIAADLGDASKRHMKLIELALSWGFTSEAHFSRAFRRKYGESPRAFRQRMAGSETRAGQ